MAGSFTVTRSPNWDKVVKRYKGARDQVGLVTYGVAVWAQDTAVREAQHQIDTLVYKAPLPPSAGPGYERTGRTRRAIRKDPIKRTPLGAFGNVRVAKEDFPAFYYPWILNRGRSGTSYWPRPFWTAMLALLRIRYRLKGREALRELRMKLSF